MTTPHEIQISGTGLFSARPCRVVLRPGTKGIRFLRSKDGIPLEALIAQQRPAHGPLGGRNTVLANESCTVATVEHLLSTLAGLGIWHADISIDADELPILDGSASAFALALQPLAALPAPGIELDRVVRVDDPASGAFIEARPATQLRYRYELRYPPGTGVPDQACVWSGDHQEYIREIAPARTFSLEKEALAMRAAGLFPHLTARDMLVIAPDGRAIDNEFRFPDEPARHKLLDLIGDLALLGGPLIAEVTAHKSSHALTHELCRRIAAARP